MQLQSSTLSGSTSTHPMIRSAGINRQEVTNLTLAFTLQLREQAKGLKRENSRLLEVNNNLERRISGMRMNGSSDQLYRAKEEIR